MTKHLKSFVRWQAITREHLSSTSNLVLGLATGLLAFQSTLLLDHKLAVPCSFVFGVLSLAFLGGSVGFALWCAINRLRDFRLTAQIAHRRSNGENDLNSEREEAKSLGKTTWHLFRAQIWALGIGVVAEVISIAVQLFQ